MLVIHESLARQQEAHCSVPWHSRDMVYLVSQELLRCLLLIGWEPFKDSHGVSRELEEFLYQVLDLLVDLLVCCMNDPPVLLLLVVSFCRQTLVVACVRDQ